MLGLTLAMRMAKQGHDVTLIEAAPTLGGLASVWDIGDVVEIGLQSDLRWIETKTGFYTNDKLYSMSDTAEFLKFPPLKMIEKLRLGATIFYASKIRNWKRLENTKVADWLIRWSGKGTFEKIWQPLLKAKLEEDICVVYLGLYQPNVQSPSDRAKKRDVRLRQRRLFKCHRPLGRGSGRTKGRRAIGFSDQPSQKGR